MDLEAVAVGTVTDDKMLRLIHKGEVVADVPADALSGRCTCLPQTIK